MFIKRFAIIETKWEKQKWFRLSPFKYFSEIKMFPWNISILQNCIFQWRTIPLKVFQLALDPKEFWDEK